MRRICVAACLAAIVACGTNSASDLQGSARVDALFNAPATGVSCIRLIASGMKRSVEQDFPVTPGQSTISFEMHGIPTGTVMFSAAAFAEPCGSITASSVPTWVADDITATVNPGPASTVQLNFHTNGNATVQGNFAADSFTVTTLAGLAGTAGSGDGTGSGARFGGPHALAFDTVDSLYLADRATNPDGTFAGMTIRKVSVTTGAVTTLAGSASSTGTDDGIGTAARFTALRAVALSGAVLYIGDGCALRAMSTSPPFTVSTVLGTRSTANPQQWDCGSSSAVGSIQDIAVRATGLYVADSVRAAISRISVTGTPSATVVAGAGSSGVADGTLSSGKFLGPMATAFPSGTDDLFYVADFGTLDGTNFFGLLRRVSLSGNSLTTVAGAQQTISAMTDGLALNALFASPQRLATDGASLFVGDLSAVRRFDLATSAVVTVAGSNTPGSADGVGTAAGLNRPSGVARSPATRAIYLADRANFTIRVMTP